MVLIFFSLMTNNVELLFFKKKSLENGFQAFCLLFLLLCISFFKVQEIFYILETYLLVCISDTVYIYVVSFLLRVTFMEKS